MKIVMSWINKIIKFFLIYMVAPVVAVELLFVLFITTGMLTLMPVLVPPYLKTSEAKLTTDANGSPIYVSGSKRYFKNVYYDFNGFLVGDYEKLENGKDNILFIGDSYTEGLQVERQQTFSSLVGYKFREKNIINLGVGGTGTYAQMIRYKSFRKTPNISDVVLFFLPQNDVLNNHPAFHEQFGLPNAPYPNSPNKFVNGKFWKNIAENFFSFRIFYYHLKTREQIFQNSTKPNNMIEGSIMTKDRAVWFNVFNEPSNNIWKEAWVYTEYSLKKLHDMTKEDGVRLHIVFVADSLQIYHYKNLINGYDFTYPNKRLSTFCVQNTMKCYDSLPYFLNYLDQNNLDFPYFSFRNDGHYAPLGHEVMASFIEHKVLNQK